MDWYRKKEKTVHVGTYVDAKSYEREAERAFAHGWIVQDTMGQSGHINARRTAARVVTGGFLLGGASRSKDQIVVTYVRAPEPMSGPDKQRADPITEAVARVMALVPAPAPPPPPPPLPPSEQVLEPGQPVSINGWVLTLEKLDTDATRAINTVNGYTESPRSLRFVLATVKATYVGQLVSDSLNKALTLRLETSEGPAGRFTGVTPNALPAHEQTGYGETKSGSLCWVAHAEALSQLSVVASATITHAN